MLSGPLSLSMAPHSLHSSLLVETADVSINVQPVALVVRIIQLFFARVWSLTMYLALDYRGDEYALSTCRLTPWSSR